MRGVDAIARILQLEGVEYLFSYPNHPLIDAAAGLGIRPIIARTEKALINIADGFCRATNGRRPAVVVVQGGPGIENAFGGIAQAAADSIPLLVLPGGPDQHRLGAPNEFDPLPSYGHITKWSARINFADRIPELLRRAFAQLRTGQPGPVLLEIPRDVGAAEFGDSLSYSPARVYRSAGDPSDIAAAARLLLAASRPILHVGHGVLWAEASDELRELAELVAVPVMTTMAGKSAFPENHPLSVGAGGHTIARAAAHFLKRADLVFGVGCSFTRGGFSAPIPAGKTMVQVTVGTQDIDKDYTIDQAVIGDAKLVLRQLIDEVKRQGGGASRPGLIEEIKGARAAEFAEWGPRLTSDETPINPYRVVRDLMNTLDRQRAIVTHDSGNPRDQTLPFFETLIPRGYLGWGKSTQLGTGLGLAIGAKLAHPDHQVVNIMGDLAFGTAGLDVETAVRERAPILTVLLNNSRMGGYGHHMPVASERYRSNQLSGRYADVAAALGAYSERVDQPGEVVAAIKRALEANAAGQSAVLEFITKEEPTYPASPRVLQSV